MKNSNVRDVATAEAEFSLTEEGRGRIEEIMDSLRAEREKLRRAEAHLMALETALQGDITGARLALLQRELIALVSAAKNTWLWPYIAERALAVSATMIEKIQRGDRGG